MQNILTPLPRVRLYHVKVTNRFGKHGLALRRPTMGTRFLIDLDRHAGSNFCGSLVFLALLLGRFGSAC